MARQLRPAVQFVIVAAIAHGVRGDEPQQRISQEAHSTAATNTQKRTADGNDSAGRPPRGVGPPAVAKADRVGVLRTFDFNERPLSNFESSPLNWVKLSGRGLPAYARGMFDERVGHEAPPSFRLSLMGANVAYAYQQSDLAVHAGSEYRVVAFARCSGLVHARGFVAACFVDAGGAPILESYAVSELLSDANSKAESNSNSNAGAGAKSNAVLNADSEAAESAGRDAGKDAVIERGRGWRKLEIVMPRADSRATSIRLEVWAAQSSGWSEQTAEAADAILHADVHGSVWFDDISIHRLPAARLRLSEATGVIRAGMSFEILGDIQNVTDSPFHGTVRVTDADGRVHHEAAFQVAPASREPVALRTPPLSPGHYRAHMRMTTGPESLVHRDLAFVVLPELEGGRAHLDGATGVELGSYSGGDPAAAAGLIATLGCGSAKIAIPMLGALDSPGKLATVREIRELLARLDAAEIECIGMLGVEDGAEQTRSGATDDEWENGRAEELSPILAQVGPLVRTWQIGRDARTRSSRSGGIRDGRGGQRLSPSPISQRIGARGPVPLGTEPGRRGKGTSPTADGQYGGTSGTEPGRGVGVESSVRRALSRMIGGAEIVIPRSLFDADLGEGGKSAAVTSGPRKEATAVAGEKAAAGDRELRKSGNANADVCSVFVPAGVPARRLAEHLGFLTKTGETTPWVSLEFDAAPELPWRLQIAELLRRIVISKALGAGRVHIDPPFELTEDSGAIAYQPTEAFIPVRTMIHALAGKRAVGVLRAGEHGVAIVFEDATSACAVAWSWELDPAGATEPLNLGPDATILDVWGNRRPLADSDGSARIPLSQTPIIVENIRAPLALLESSFRVAPGEVVIEDGKAAARITFQNRFDMPMSGSVEIRTPGQWSVTPEKASFALPPGGEFDQAVEIRTPANISAALSKLAVVLRVEKPEAAEMHFDVPVRTTATDVTMSVETRWADGGLVVIQEVQNGSKQELTFTGFCQIAGRPRLEREFLKIPPGQKARQRYAFSGERGLRGGKLHVGIREIGGTRAIDELAPVP